ncbi:sodium ABC transporter [Lachnospiraceae bacterium]|uniref:ABC transporter permease n=1 Tax=Extibacter sp. GGCC_0201 TaxID=2731209 RepID=UPI001AA111BB|nr:ABC transporter permease [Extibacter sp. GGCC_0201]MBO1721971.1 ABC transporter permease [Extibacter sp. GGCC_0201]BDF32928.1 sodium ABC transporter [Lachnospiraceae bacterium]BDF36933.1 sodium ABC transporter [Lachnospiraceae bacterium]
MNGIKHIFGKEMARIFKDKKMVFSVFFLPVLIMILIMTIISGLVSNMEDDIESHESVVYVANEPASFKAFLGDSKQEFKSRLIDAGGMEKAKKDILDGKADLIIEFPDGFEDAVGGYEAGNTIPQVKTYYNPSEDYSKAAYENISGGVLEAYRQSLLAGRVEDLAQLTVFTVNSDNEDMIIQDDEKASGKAIGMMLPYFITILLFAGAMGIGTDMIAGEKERGTMASLLVSPVKRSSIVLGKVFSLMTISGISSLIYVIAMVVCAPLMMKSMVGSGADSLNINLSVQQVVMLGALLVAIAFLYSSIIALVSVFAKSTKEANTYVMPAYMLVLIIGLLTMFTTGDPTQTDYYIPLYNSALVMKGILGQNVTMLQYGITLIETLVIGGVLLGVIVKAFQSEKVMNV